MSDRAMDGGTSVAGGDCPGNAGQSKMEVTPPDTKQATLDSSATAMDVECVVGITDCLDDAARSYISDSNAVAATSSEGGVCEDTADALCSIASISDNSGRTSADGLSVIAVSMESASVISSGLGISSVPMEVPDHAFAAIETIAEETEAIVAEDQLIRVPVIVADIESSTAQAKASSKAITSVTEGTGGVTGEAAGYDEAPFCSSLDAQPMVSAAPTNAFVDTATTEAAVTAEVIDDGIALAEYEESGPHMLADDVSDSQMDVGASHDVTVGGTITIEAAPDSTYRDAVPTTPSHERAMECLPGLRCDGTASLSIGTNDGGTVVIPTRTTTMALGSTEVPRDVASDGATSTAMLGVYEDGGNFSADAITTVSALLHTADIMAIGDAKEEGSVIDVSMNLTDSVSLLETHFNDGVSGIETNVCRAPNGVDSLGPSEGAGSATDNNFTKTELRFSGATETDCPPDASCSGAHTNEVNAGPKPTCDLGRDSCEGTDPHGKSFSKAHVLPPDDVEWANRWTELENITAALEVDRDALKVEVAQLRRQRIDQAMTALSNSTKAAAVDTKEFQEVKALLDEERHKAELYLGEVVAERKKNTALSEELQRRTADLANLSAEKLRIQLEKSAAESELLPVRQERDRILYEKEEAVRRILELQAELDRITAERTAIFLENADQRRDLMQQINEARAIVAFHEQAIAEAQEAQSAARHQVSAVEKQLRDKTEDFAAKFAALESKLNLRGEQLSRLTELRKVAQHQLEDALRDRDAAVESQACVAREAEELRLTVAGLEDALKQLQGKQEGLLNLLPEGALSVSELFQETTRAREEVLRERHAKEQLQEILREVEHEVRVRYPALVSQREEAERLRHAAELLTHQNEGLLAQVQELERSKKEGAARVQKAERYQQILEAHARDMSKQLAVLLHENQRLSGVPLVGVHGEAESTALEADLRLFRTVQELTEQNEVLQRSVARLTEECKSSAQSELQGVADEQDQRMEEWKQHLAEKAEQMKVLVETIERITRERDEAQRALDDKQTPSQPPTERERAAPPPRDGLLRDQLKAVREEFAKCTEVLHKETRELRASELKLRQELATTIGRLDFEISRKADLQTSLQKTEERLKERQAQLQALEERIAGLEENRERQQSARLDLEAELGQTRRDLSKHEMQARLERKKVTTLEQQNATLLLEKTAYVQLVVDLQARVAQESDAYKEMKRDLEASYTREEELLHEQLELSKQRQDDLKRTADELGIARAARELEAVEAKAKASELQIANARLEEQLALRIEEIHKLHAAGSARPRRGAEVAAEALAQLERSRAPRERALDLKQLQEKLRFAEEREQEHTKSGQLWQTLMKTHVADLRARLDEVAELQKTVESLKREQVKVEGERDEVRRREQQLEQRLQEVGSEVADLRAALDRKDAEVAAARLEGEKKAHEAVSRLETAERESAGSRDVVEEWQQRHREAVCAHSKDIQVFNDMKERYTAIQKEVKELSKRCGELRGEAERARGERADELDEMRQKLEHAERHAKALAAEVRKYQDEVFSGASVVRGSLENASDIQKRIAAEMKRAREISELQQQELELDKARLEREAKASHATVVDLQHRLDAAEREVLQMQFELRHRQQAVTKLGQLGLLEDDNRRLLVEIKSLEGQREELRKEIEVKKLEAEPLQRMVRELQKKEEESDRIKRELEAQAEEWKRLHSEVVLKFDAFDVHEFKKLKDESAEWKVQRSELTARIENLHSDLKQRSDELRQKQEELRQRHAEFASNKTMKEKHEEVQKALDQEKQRVAQLLESGKKRDVDLKHMESLKMIRDRRIEDMDKELKKIREDEKRKVAEAAKVPAQAVASLRKAEEETRLAQQRADKAISLAMDYQRIMAALIAENKELEQREAHARAARERAVRQGEAYEHEMEVQQSQEQEAHIRVDTDANVPVPGVSLGVGIEPGVGTGVVVAAPPAQMAALSTTMVDTSAGVKRKVSTIGAGGNSPSTGLPSGSGGTTPGGQDREPAMKIAKAVTREIAGLGDVASSTHSKMVTEAKATSPTAKKAPAATKVAVRTRQATLVVGAETSVGPDVSVVVGVGDTGGGRTSTDVVSSVQTSDSARGPQMVVDLEEAEPPQPQPK